MTLANLAQKLRMSAEALELFEATNERQWRFVEDDALDVIEGARESLAKLAAFGPSTTDFSTSAQRIRAEAVERERKALASMLGVAALSIEADAAPHARRFGLQRAILRLRVQAAAEEGLALMAGIGQTRARVA